MPKIIFKKNRHAKIVVTILGKIELEDFEDFGIIEEIIEKIREYGEAEIVETELVEI